MERVVKGIMGYGAAKDGKPATHVILTVDEHEHMEKKIEFAREKIKELKSSSEKEILNCKKETENIITAEKEKAQATIKAIDKDLVEANAEIDRLNNLNCNLLRISLERANAKRGLKPKKVHHGYMVLDCQQYSYTKRVFSGRRYSNESLPCWKVRIQTPYDSSIPFEVISVNIQNDLVKVFGSSLGLKTFYKYDDLEELSIDDIKGLWISKDNFIFKVSYKSNYKAGLWEVEYLTKGSISFPEDMRIN